MNRLLIVGLAVLLAMPCAIAGTTRQGAYDFELRASYLLVNASVTDDNDNVTDEGQAIAVGRMSRYLTDKFQFGGLVSFQSQTWDSYWGHQGVFGLGILAEYDIVAASAVVPYVGLSAALISRDDDMVVQFTPGVGLKIFLSDTVAFSCGAELNIASEEVYAFERIGEDTTSGESNGTGKNTGFSANAGIKFLFF